MHQGASLPHSTLHAAEQLHMSLAARKTDNEASEVKEAAEWTTASSASRVRPLPSHHKRLQERTTGRRLQLEGRGRHATLRHQGSSVRQKQAMSSSSCVGSCGCGLSSPAFGKNHSCKIEKGSLFGPPEWILKIVVCFRHRWMSHIFFCWVLAEKMASNFAGEDARTSDPQTARDGNPSTLPSTASALFAFCLGLVLHKQPLTPSQRSAGQGRHLCVRSMKDRTLHRPELSFTQNHRRHEGSWCGWKLLTSFLKESATSRCYFAPQGAGAWSTYGTNEDGHASVHILVRLSTDQETRFSKLKPFMHEEPAEVNELPDFKEAHIVSFNCLKVEKLQLCGSECSRRVVLSL